MQIVTTDREFAIMEAMAQGLRDDMKEYWLADFIEREVHHRRDTNHYVKLQREAMSELQMRLQFGEHDEKT